MIVFTLTWIGLGCWGVCFWWMHRISSRQDVAVNIEIEATRVQ